MNTVTKIVATLIVVILIAIAGSLYYLVSSLDQLVAGAIEKYGSKATGTTVQVESVSIKLREGKGSIAGLSIANPPGFSTPHAFTLGQANLAIDLDALKKEKIVLNEISILKTQIFYEINADGKDNLRIIKQNLAQREKPKKGEQEPITLTIRRFVMTGNRLQARIIPLGNKQKELELPPLTLTDLNGTPDQITQQIMTQLLGHVRREIQNSGIARELKGKLEEKVNSTKEELKDKAKEKLKGLFD